MVRSFFADVGGWIFCLEAATGKLRWSVDTRATTFPGHHWNNLLMASPILADGKVIFAGGTLEQLFAGTFGYKGSTGRGFVVALEPKTGKIVWKFDVGPKPERLNPPVKVVGDWEPPRLNLDLPPVACGRLPRIMLKHNPSSSAPTSIPHHDSQPRTTQHSTPKNRARSFVLMPRLETSGGSHSSTPAMSGRTPCGLTMARPNCIRISRSVTRPKC